MGINKYRCRGIGLLVFMILISVVLINLKTNVAAETATKKYGIVIASQDGKYTFYDWNSLTDTAGIEINSAGNIMVPLKKLAAQMNLSYSYNTTTKKATVTNKANGKKIVFTKNSKYCYYYSSSKAAAVKKTMVAATYVSSKSSYLMIHMSSLKWVLASTYGFQYYNIADMQSVGYDTSVYSGLIVYNRYSKVSTIPKATNVIGISNTVKVTIPEGYSVSQVFNLLVKKGVCASTDSLYEALNNYDFSYYPLVNELEPNVNRCFRLEGYLFPDTYEFYRLTKAENVIGKFLRNTDVKLTEADRTKAASMGYTVDEILTIASMIQKEAGSTEMMPNIASVIYNRLNKPMRLQLDCTIFYVERYIKPYISGDINRYNQYYNTYKCSALPAGPICNPGAEAIQAALNPAVTDYLYFYSDTEGNYYFAATYEEFLALQTQDVPEQDVSTQNEQSIE